MNLTSEALIRFRMEVRSWLSANIPECLVIPRPDQDMSLEIEEWVLGFRRKLGGHGWLAPNWPAHFGGGNLSPQAGFIIMEELKRFSLPPLGLNTTFLVPLRVWGTEQQKAKWLVPTLRGEITVHQIQSEPSTGTDLAHQSTTAVRDGDDYIVNGEKGFIASPMTADYLFILVTTNPDGVKYENLSMIILNARDPGVSVRSRKMLTGRSQRSFIIKDVRVPLEDVIGGEGGGWKVAQTLLDVERGGMGANLEQQKMIEEREGQYWG
jgi:alkylation response protein AidB-like acyl-CoA dehydrogenase